MTNTARSRTRSIRPWLSDPAEVSSLHTFLLRIYAQPAERLALTWERDSDKAMAAALDLSHRLTVDRRAITDSYFIESILHRVTADFHFITYTLELRRACTARYSCSGCRGWARGFWRHRKAPLTGGAWGCPRH